MVCVVLCVCSVAAAAPPIGLPSLPLPGAGERKPLVRAELLADVSAVQAGKPFRLGVRLRMADKWHVYWRYPGDAGEATDVAFRAPKGFRVGPIQWPTPVGFDQPDEADALGGSANLADGRKIGAEHHALPRDHHEEMRPVRHLPHQSHFHKQSK